MDDQNITVAADPTEAEKNEWKQLPALPDGFEAYFLPPNTYYIKDGRGEWMAANEKTVIRQLKRLGRSGKTEDGEPMSETEAALLEIQSEGRIHAAGNVAGRPSGVVETPAGRRLILAGPRIITPKDVPWDHLRQFLEGLLDGEADQLIRFHGWMKVAHETLCSGQIKAGQVLILAGPPDCGKSLLQKIITELLGGRAAEPYQFMSGETQFNADLVAAEHHVVEDEFGSTDYRKRKQFAAQIKMVATGAGQRIHAKGHDAYTMDSFRRMSISVNEEPENLMVLPPLDDSIEDKLLAFLVRTFKFSLPTGTDDERSAFWDTIRKELPGYLHFLRSWEIPEKLRSRRHGIKSFVHPQIREALSALTPEESLLELIYESGILYELGVGNQARKPRAWRGTQTELANLLMDHLRNTSYSARALLNHPSRCGILLERLSRDYPKLVRKARTADRRWWIIVSEELQHLPDEEIRRQLDAREPVRQAEGQSASTQGPIAEPRIAFSACAVDFTSVCEPVVGLAGGVRPTSPQANAG